MAATYNLFFHAAGCTKADAASVLIDAEGGTIIVPQAGCQVVLPRKFWDIKHTGKDHADADTVARLYVARGAAMPTNGNVVLQATDDAANQAAKALVKEIVPGEALALRLGELPGVDTSLFLQAEAAAGPVKVRLSAARASVG